MHLEESLNYDIFAFFYYPYQTHLKNANPCTYKNDDPNPQQHCTLYCTVLYCTVSLYLIGDEGGELGEVVEVSRLDPVPGLCVSHADLMQIYHFIYYSMNFVPFFSFFYGD